MREFVALTMATVLAMSCLQAQGSRMPVDVSKLGAQVGERVPDFSLPDQSGRVRNLQSVMGARGAMLVFVRSADW